MVIASRRRPKIALLAYFFVTSEYRRAAKNYFQGHYVDPAFVKTDRAGLPGMIEY